MEWPRLPRSSCKCPVQLLLCPPSHSQLCDLPLHLSPRPQPQRHARANEPGSSSPSSSSREAAAEPHLPTPSSAHSKESASDNLSIQHSSRLLPHLHSSLSENSIDFPPHPTHQSNPSPHPSLQLLLTSSPSLHTLISSTFLTSFFPTLQPLVARARAALPRRTCNGFENYVRRVRQRGSARAGRAEGLGTAPSGSSAPPSSHIINLDSDDDL